MANGHGGARRGAGRKPKAEKFARPIAGLERRLADALPDLGEALLKLASGGTPRVEETFEPAGLVTVEVLEIADDGKATRGRRLAFPDVDPGTLVLTERRVSTLAPDRAAITYAIDRILGRPDVGVEPEAIEAPKAEEDYVLDLGGGPDASDSDPGGDGPPA